jgi:hypothetical protein
VKLLSNIYFEPRKKLLIILTICDRARSSLNKNKKEVVVLLLLLLLLLLLFCVILYFFGLTLFRYFFFYFVFREEFLISFEREARYSNFFFGHISFSKLYCILILERNTQFFFFC